MEIRRLFERPDGRQRGGVGGVEGERAGEVDFGNPDAGVVEKLEGGPHRFVLQREVAGVVVHADPAPDGGGIRGMVTKALEERDGFRFVFEMAEWLGFQAEMKVVAGFFR